MLTTMMFILTTKHYMAFLAEMHLFVLIWSVSLEQRHPVFWTNKLH